MFEWQIKIIISVCRSVETQFRSSVQKLNILHENLKYKAISIPNLFKD